MSATQIHSPIAPTNPPVGATATAIACGLWIGCQFAAIALTASRVQLWSRSPTETEHLALAALLATQLSALLLLFPILLSSWRAATTAAICGLVFAQFAGILADLPTATWLNAELFPVAWLVALWLAAGLLHYDRARVYAAGFGAILAIGMPLLIYLRLDFAADAIQPDVTKLLWLSPVLGAVSHTFPEGAPLSSWLTVALLLVVAGPLRIRQVIHCNQRAYHVGKSNKIQINAAKSSLG